MPIPGDGPTPVACSADAWTKVAEGVESGFVWLQEIAIEYLQTWRYTGEAAPSDRGEGVALDQPGQAINATEAIDVYVYAIDKDGEVRVDV